jgi:anti-anti-sigma factor
MKIDVTAAQDVQILAFQGSLDSNTSPDAETQVNAVIDAGHHRLLLNFAELEYISSAGLRLVLGTARRLGDAKGELRLCGLNQRARMVFDITGFSNVLNIADSEEEALATF